MTLNAQQSLERDVTQKVQAAMVYGLLWGLHRVLYDRRLKLGGWVLSRVVTPLTGCHRRIQENLALIFPEMPAADAAQLSQDVSRNIGVTFTELFPLDDFLTANANYALHGAGFEALEHAHALGRPTIVVSGHFGNYDVVRANLLRHGLRFGGGGAEWTTHIFTTST